MSNSVVAAAAVSRAKHLVPNKKIKKLTEDQRQAHDEQQAADREHQSNHVVQTGEANSHASVVDNSMSGEFSFANALAGAAQDSASLSGFAQDGGSGSSDEGSGGSGTLLAIGAVGLVGAGVAVLASGGSKEENLAPTVSAATQAVTTAEDTAKVITVAATDPNSGDTLTYTVPATGTGAPTKGTVTVGANGSLTYTPNANVNGTDTFVVTVKDQDGLSVTQTVTVTITPVDDAPLADSGNSNTVTLAEDATSVPFVISYTDPDTGNATGLVLSTVTPPAHGTWVSNASGNFYTPTANYNGTDSITYKVTDSTGASTTHTVNFTITPVNDAPVTAETQAVTTAAGVAAAVTVTATDIDSTTLTYTAGTGATGPAHGTVAAGATPGTFTYTPTAGFVGTDAFTVTVSDGTLTDTQIVNVTIGNPVTTTSIDVGNPFGSSDPITIDVSGGAFHLTNDATKNSFVTITGLTPGAGHDDTITFTNLANISDLNFTSAGSDLQIDWQNTTAGTAEKITITNVFTSPVFIENYADVTAALGFNLITIA